MLHLKNDGYLPRHSRDLVHKARDLCVDLDTSIRVARVASKFIELDVSVSQEKMPLMVEKLSPIGTLDNARHVFEEEISKEKGIEDGIFYFNHERFWESHEAFEGVWKKCVGREKELVQGIILLAVAFAHAQKDEHNIGLGMLKRSLDKLGNSPSTYTTIDIARIRDHIRKMQSENKLTLFEI